MLFIELPYNLDKKPTMALLLPEEEAIRMAFSISRKLFSLSQLIYELSGMGRLREGGQTNDDDDGATRQCGWHGGAETVNRALCAWRVSFSCATHKNGKVSIVLAFVAQKHAFFYRKWVGNLLYFRISRCLFSENGSDYLAKSWKISRVPFN